MSYWGRNKRAQHVMRDWTGRFVAAADVTNGGVSLGNCPGKFQEVDIN